MSYGTETLPPVHVRAVDFAAQQRLLHTDVRQIDDDDGNDDDDEMHATPVGEVDMTAATMTTKRMMTMPSMDVASVVEMDIMKAEASHSVDDMSMTMMAKAIPSAMPMVDQKEKDGHDDMAMMPKKPVMTTVMTNGPSITIMTTTETTMSSIVIDMPTPMPSVVMTLRCFPSLHFNPSRSNAGGRRLNKTNDDKDNATEAIMTPAMTGLDRFFNTNVTTTSTTMMRIILIGHRHRGFQVR